MSLNIAEWKDSVQNGRIPIRLLAEVEPNQFDYDLGGPALMHPEAAAAMSALLAAAREDGCNFRVKYSYRTYEKQVEKWNDFLNGGNKAAPPGTSNHGWALAVDLTDLGENDINWLLRNAHRFGFDNEVVGEIWHWTYYGGYDAGKDDKDMEQYVAGWDKYIERWNNGGGEDPGEAPKDREKMFKKGWGHARKALNNPKG